MYRGALFLVAVLQYTALASNTVVLEGTVQDALTGNPLPGSRITLRHVRIGDSHPVRYSNAGDDGHFQFSNLPPGLYDIDAEAGGYVGYPTRPSPRVKVQSGGRSEQVSVRLFPLGTVAGRVLGEDGKPFTKGIIYADRIESNLRVFSAIEPDGSFRMKIAPGDYRLSFRTPLAQRKQTVDQDPDTKETRAYPERFFYPGIDELESALVIPISPGAFVPIDFHLRRQVAVSLRGRAVDQVTGRPIQNARIALSNSVPDPTLRQTDADGRFEIPLVKPGAHTLLLYMVPGSSELPYSANVIVGPVGLDDFVLNVSASVRVEGRALSPDAKPVVWRPVIVVMSTLDPSLRFRSATISEDGGFVLDSVPPGRYRLAVNPMMRFSNPFYVSNLSVNGESQSVSESLSIIQPTNLEITLSAGARVNVKVTDSDGGESAILLESPGGRIDILQIPVDGSISVTGLAPGRYTLTAVRRNTSSVCSNGSVTFDLSPGEVNSVTLKRCE
jgi:hypothetical protein